MFFQRQLWLRNNSLMVVRFPTNYSYNGLHFKKYGVRKWRRSRLWNPRWSAELPLLRNIYDYPDALLEMNNLFKRRLQQNMLIFFLFTNLIKYLHFVGRTLSKHTHTHTKKTFPTGFEPVSLESHLAGWTHRPKARNSCQYRRWPPNHRFPGHFFDDFLNFLKRNGRDVNRRSHTSRL